METLMPHRHRPQSKRVAAGLKIQWPLRFIGSKSVAQRECESEAIEMGCVALPCARRADTKPVGITDYASWTG
eukprot:1929502-Amphidinium_carterae.1